MAEFPKNRPEDIGSKENINTMDGSGELLFTILSSLAQDESRSISENCQWGIRSLFKQGVIHINTNRFYGYDKDEDGKLVINPDQGKVVKWLFESYMDGMNPDVLARKLNEQKVPGCMGEPKWTVDTILSILQNEKHKGDAILQKTFTEDYLTKKQAKNEGQVAQYYISDDHEPIVSRELWEVTQLEIKRRREFLKTHGLRTLGRYTDEQPFTSRVFCGVCGNPFWRRTGYRKTGTIKTWMCSTRYYEKGVKSCGNDLMKEEILHEAFIEAWNYLLENRDLYVPEWEKKVHGDDLLVAYRAKQFLKLTKKAKPMRELDKSIVSKTFEKSIIYPMGAVEFYFLDGTVVEVDTIK